MLRTAVVGIVIVFASVAACSSDDDGDGGGGTTAGVDRTKLVSGLTTEEKTALCDWYAPQVGGYGAADACELVGISAPDDVADCLYGFPVCSVKVGDLVDCFTKIINAETTCTEAANMAAVTSSVCAKAAPCFSS
jgi:hypothetical protein